MPSIFLVGASLLVAYGCTFVYCFVRNIFKARKSGLPAVTVPWDQNHWIWMVVSVPLRPVLKEKLPAWIYNRIVLCIYGWEFHEKRRPFEEYAGPQGNDKSYVLLSCGSFEFWTCDPEINVQITSRPRDFVQLKLTELFMGRFGHNLLTTDGDRWARQRKVIAPVINERISTEVFRESVQQTGGLLEELESAADDKGALETNKMFDWAKKITINVLSGAGMGARVSWTDESTEEPPSGFKMTYIQSVKAVLEAVTGAMLLPLWFLLNYPTFLPGHKAITSMGYGIQEFPIHTTNLLNNERSRMQTVENVTRGNIMSQLLRASEQSSDGNVKSGKGTHTKVLSDDEMMGNLFIFTAAGFDTTANTVSYAMVLLARYPQWQDWLLQEIDELQPKDSSVEPDYAATFPRAVRLLAFMFETLRLFPPLIHIAKETATNQTIQTSHGNYFLPAKTQIFVSLVALHLDPSTWRNLNLGQSDEATEDDHYRFRPSRWINAKGSHQALFQPPRGTYAPWSAGPRVCPGQKMALVEFVGIMLTLLRNHRIDAVAIGDERRKDVEMRLDQRMKDSTSILTSQMNNVYDVSESDEKGLKLRVSRR